MPSGKPSTGPPPQPRPKVELALDRAKAIFDPAPIAAAVAAGQDTRRIEVDVQAARRSGATDPELTHAFDDLLERYPALVHAAEMLVMLHAVQHDLASAARTASRALEHDPDNHRLLLNLGTILLNLEKGKEAGIILQRVADASHGQALPYFLLAQAHRIAGRFDLAHETALRAIACPDDGSDDHREAILGALNMLGVLAVERGRPDEGADYLEQARTIDPENELVRGNIDWSKERAASGYCRKMVEAYRRLGKDMDDLAALHTIAAGLVTRDFPALALPYIQSILQRAPADGAAHGLLFQARMAMGDPSAGIAELRRAVEAGLADQDPSIRFHLGSALFDRAMETSEEAPVLEALGHFRWYVEHGHGHPTFGEYGLIAGSIVQAIESGHIEEALRARAKPAPAEPAEMR